MQLYLFQILTHRYLHLHLPLMHVFHINIYMYIYDMCYVYIILYSYLYVHMHKKTCLSHKIYPGKTSPRTPFLQPSPGRYGSSSTWCIASHGSKEILAMYLEVWEKKRLSWFVYKKKIGGNKFDFFLQRLLFASKKIFIVCTFYCLFAMCSEPLAVSSDIYGTCLVVFLEADASKQHLWHLGWFCQDDRCDFTLTMFFVPKTFFCLNTHLKFAITPEHIPIPKKRTGSSSWPTIFQG